MEAIKKNHKTEYDRLFKIYAEKKKARSIANQSAILKAKKVKSEIPLNTSKVENVENNNNVENNASNN